MEMLTNFYHLTATASISFWLILIPFVLVVWFVPSLLALFFNRKHAKFIFLANIPAGFSFIAWGACIVWAVSGKVSQRLAHKRAQDDGKI